MTIASRQDHKDIIQEIVDRHLVPGSLDFIKAGITYPVRYKAFHETLDAKSGEIRTLVFGMMKDFRRTGVCSACPNNGPRNARGVSAWDGWVAGDDLVPRTLWLSPAFSLIPTLLVETTIRVGMDKEIEADPGGKISSSAQDVPLDETDVDLILSKAIATARSRLLKEEISPYSQSESFTCSLTGVHMRVGGRILSPVLLAFDGKNDLVVAEKLEEPAPARTIELSLPSGRLAMADWFRIPGFNEGVKAIVGKDRYELNCAQGLDERARAYYEELGLVVVQIGNTSPSAFVDTPGVWRMGRVDEDHEHFWTECGEPTGAIYPEPAWGTLTDLWANTFADPDVVVDILMASGTYADRRAATEALEDYCRKTSGAGIHEVGTDRLYVCMPTGYGSRRDDLFASQVQAKELDYPEWRQDMYLLSTSPLSIDPALLESGSWTEGRIDPSISKRDQVVAPTP